MLDTYLPPSSSQSHALIWPWRFGALLHPLVDVTPTVFRVSIFFKNQSERLVPEGDDRYAARFLQPILKIRYDRVRHKQWSGNFKQGRLLDRLHRSPVMAVVVSQVAIPSAAGPCFELHGHWLVGFLFFLGAGLLERGGEVHLIR